MPIKLYGYFRSSASYRVRAALNLKNVDYKQTFVHLRKGEQFDKKYVKLNPQEQLPTLVTEQGDVLVQSPAILEWLDEQYPWPALLPKEPLDRQRVRALAAVIGCDVHPIDNLRVLKYVTGELDASQEKLAAWFNHWITLGFNGFEAMLADDARTGDFCHGDAPSMADVYLVPQVFNSKRFGLSLDPWPNIARIYENCNALPAFDDAKPQNQPDWEE